jgi:excisionase family DNA binding protein
LKPTRGFAGCTDGTGSGRLLEMPLFRDNLDLAGRIASRKSAWTVEDLALLLELSPKTLYKMAKSGNIPAIRIGGMIRFDPVLIAESLTARTTGTGFRQRRAA